jgi:PAP2 superfamily
VPQVALPSGSPSRDRNGVAWSLRRGIGREIVLVGAAMLAYFGIRNATVGHPDEAIDNARRIVSLEQRLGVAWEHGLQAGVVGTNALVTLANWVYIWGHWPVILTAAGVLYVVAPDRYRLLRNALFVSGSIGFLFFALLPVAPPRLLGLGFVDTVTEQSESYRALQPPGLTNQYAAMPSLHAGWNLLVGIVLFATFASLAVRLFAVLMPVAMALAVIVTANHFVVDVVVGFAIVFVGLGVSVLIERSHLPATLARDGLERDGGPRGGTWSRSPGGAAAVRRRSPRGQPR